MGGSRAALAACLRAGLGGLPSRQRPSRAVVVDPGGDLVTQGRSRSNEPTGPSGQLAGTSLAHAEVNALAGLAPGDYWSHVLYTTLEPCLLCTAALTHAHVGAVRYAASDP